MPADSLSAIDAANGAPAVYTDHVVSDARGSTSRSPRPAGTARGVAFNAQRRTAR